ncbi:MAG: hypothetical protein Q7S51_02890 [Gallionellaceae bacterium]|nr:hypothetical protein [Gallionellaceae bacterium]
MRLPLVFVVAALSLVVGSFSLSASHAQPASATDLATLITSLRASGAGVKLGEKVDQPFFSVPGKIITLNGEDIQVFQFPDVTTIAAQAAQISPDGNNVGTSKPMWIEPPHFFRKGKLLALYIGNNDQVLKALTTVLGQQFAGK